MNDVGWWFRGTKGSLLDFSFGMIVVTGHVVGSALFTQKNVRELSLAAWSAILQFLIFEVVIWSYPELLSRVAVIAWCNSSFLLVRFEYLNTRVVGFHCCNRKKKCFTHRKACFTRFLIFIHKGVGWKWGWSFGELGVDLLDCFVKFVYTIFFIYWGCMRYPRLCIFLTFSCE